MVANYMRLRALRVEVDVKLALGTFTIPQAAEYLANERPDGRGDRAERSGLVRLLPGQAITYQIGKLQVLRLLAEAKRAQGDAFQLRTFHDFVYRNGNVPLLPAAVGAPRPAGGRRRARHRALIVRRRRGSAG